MVDIFHLIRQFNGVKLALSSNSKMCTRYEGHVESLIMDSIRCDGHVESLTLDGIGCEGHVESLNLDSDMNRIVDIV